MARDLLRLSRDADVEPALLTIRVPMLVLHRSGDRRVGIDSARHLAARIPGATLVELPGEDHLPYVGDSARLVSEIAAFLSRTTAEKAA